MIILYVGISVIAIPFLIISAVTLLFALITSIRQQRNGHKNGYFTSLYCGRVSHARFQPVVHSFSYPLFFCCLDLSEVPALFLGESLNNDTSTNGNENEQVRRKLPVLWPLSLLMSFNEKDHLKNGEGITSDASVNENSIPSDLNSMPSRIRRLISERTKGKCSPAPNQQILLLTHLSYFGYCFNPVSFYYVLKEPDNSHTDGGKIEAIVAEVSNTPWNEMNCYVLHPDSVDMLSVKEGRTRKCTDSTCWKINPSLITCVDANKDTKKSLCNEQVEKSTKIKWKSTNYIFRKTFHVSPFMDMQHIYDWTFWDLSPATNRIVASTTMLKEKSATENYNLSSTIAAGACNSSSLSSANKVKYFNAFFDIEKMPFTPFSLCYQLIRLPVYCLIIQIWIHVEAFRLFLKGVEFIPHPKGTETAASKIIGIFMEPFFAVKSWLDTKFEKNDKVD